MEKTHDRVPAAIVQWIPSIAALFTIVMPCIFYELADFVDNYRPAFGYCTPPWVEALYKALRFAVPASPALGMLLTLFSLFFEKKHLGPGGKFLAIFVFLCSIVSFFWFLYVVS
ncbi:MAG: hypothetical protein LBV79_12170 [Candidatus Adiutrix sp.]|jgi:hypothetical protein|nr:hypothetical protein [Candidatus Adiutrix sp.]